jgi:hypothetical protein
MCGGCLELYSGLNVVFVLLIGMKDVASLPCVTVGAAALSEYVGDIGRAVMISGAWLPGLLTQEILPATVQTLLEIPDIDDAIDGNCKNKKQHMSDKEIDLLSRAP